MTDLPPLPSGLKPLAPFVQRADELKSKEPIMAYWCTYHAAQLGLDIKSQQPGAREYLFALITRLEEMKKGLGSNDAIDNESAGAAYVENFALKVFGMADSDDRSGNATRSTAKKFLAAANFLELLKVFEKSNNAQVNQEKIRYAKWKAADIAKAFREGRKPTPGSAGDGPESYEPLAAGGCSPPTLSRPPDAASTSVGQSPRGDTQTPLPKTSPQSFTVDVTTPPPSAPPFAFEPQTPPKSVPHMLGSFDLRSDAVSPSNWSTVATPGTEDYPPHNPDVLSFESALNGRSFAAPDDSPLRTRNASQLSGDSLHRRDGLDGEEMPAGLSHVPSSTYIDPSPYQQDMTMPKKVHFSPSVVGGLSSVGGSPVVSPAAERQTFVPMVPPFVVEPHTVPLPGSGSSNSSPTSLGSAPPALPGSSPPLVGIHGGLPTTTPSSIRPSPAPFYHHQQSPPSVTKPQLPPPPPPPPVISTPARPTVELSASLIAKAQKHCRFAISSLDYEDAEHARKELRAALAILGD